MFFFIRLNEDIVSGGGDGDTATNFWKQTKDVHSHHGCSMQSRDQKKKSKEYKLEGGGQPSKGKCDS